MQLECHEVSLRYPTVLKEQFIKPMQCNAGIFLFPTNPGRHILRIQASILPIMYRVCKFSRSMPNLERPTRSPGNSRLLYHTTTTPSTSGSNTRPRPRRRRSSQSARSTRSLDNGSPNSRAHANLNLAPAPSRIIALLLARFLGSGALAVRGHLGLDFHTFVEF